MEVQKRGLFRKEAPIGKSIALPPNFLRLEKKKRGGSTKTFEGKKMREEKGDKEREVTPYLANRQFVFKTIENSGRWIRILQRENRFAE